MANPSDGYRIGNGLLGTTRWSLVRRAATGGESLEIWAAACWYPLYAWARRKDWEPEDAADAVQEFLGKICTRGLLARADPARGKFRSWVLTAFGNHLSSRSRGARALKRGGGSIVSTFSINGPSRFFRRKSLRQRADCGVAL